MAELVVFYSLTGKSREVAERLATALNAQIEEIVEERPRGFAFRGLFRSALETLLRLRPSIKAMHQREGIFDRVILVCPVWGGMVAAPARTWLHRYGRGAKSLGVVLLSGDGVARPGTLREFESIIGRRPKPLLTMSEYDFRDRAVERKVEAFVRSITTEAAKFPVS